MSDDGALPDGLLLAFYGDDFTGSSAVMEVMTFAGLPAVMFVEAPSVEQLRRFSGHRAIGVASIARAQPPSWMDANLPPVFEALAALNAPVNHYKVCSTLDSSPTIGSIGRAIDIGAPIFGKRAGAANWQPMVVAAPDIGRYQAFGHLFAAHGADVFRLDKHPVMRTHPVTPMDEADVRVHVAQQTSRPIGLIDFVAMKRSSGVEQFEVELRQGRSVISLDVVDEETLRWVGRLIWSARREGIFAIGSQGVEYALVAHWRAEGMLPAAVDLEPVFGETQIVAVSGSVSAVTAGQIEWAEANGFDIIRLDVEAVLEDRRWGAELDAVVERAFKSLSCGRSPLVVTARGPDDDAVTRLREKLKAHALDSPAINARIGRGLGDILKRLVRGACVKRAAVSGGDSSGYAMRALGAYALEALAPLAPGAPLCRVFSEDPDADGFQVALKGGQMGAKDFFGSVRAGRATFGGGHK